MEFRIIRDLFQNYVSRETNKKVMEKTKYALSWTEQFKANPDYNYLRFKIITGQFDHLNYEFDFTLLDSVDIDTFIMVEENRIPLFIGTQFGIYPNIEEIPNFLSQDKIIAILGRSLLSGHVAGLGIYKLLSNYEIDRRIEIMYFKNESAQQINKPKLSDGAPKGYYGNHHLWFIKQYRKWLSQKRINPDQK